MKWTKILAVLLLSIAAQISQASSSSQGVFELKLKTFLNKYGKNSEGHCCDGFRSVSNGKCSGSCATKFRICLKHYQATIDPVHECTFGEYVTPILGNNSIFSKSQVIQFPLDFKWPGTFSLIIEAWHENNKTDNALISRMATQQELDAGHDWTHGVHQESHTRLEYEYRIVCSAQYYGKDCDTLCRPRDDQFGHYTCDHSGNKMCLDGWQKDPNNEEGDYCTKAVCAPGCHEEHGYCDRPGECKCRDGWTGAFCTECVRYPGCQHGTCNKEPWTCICEEGWGGLFCNQDLNYCTNNRPCQNGATCFNTGQGSYTCSCPPGWTGTNCETRITNECAHNLCVNGGTCQGTGVNNYTCVCPLGFHGVHCELQAQTCSDHPCKNGAHCHDTPSGYECKCEHGFTGVNCDVKLDTCRMATPCLNGGTCLMDSDQDDKYQCICPSGFAGTHCENNIDDCAVNPCQNGGTCIDFVSDYKCYCNPGFIGTHCEENVNECAINPCANGGTCHDSVNDFVCACPPGFAGKDCSVEVNECANNPCMNNGFCVDKLNDYECRCLPGYSGKACNVLPDGTVMPLTGGNSIDQGPDVTLIACLSTLLTLLMILGCLLTVYKKKRQHLEQRKANAEAKRENELNAVSCVNKTKMLDEHMIVNDLQYPRVKRINGGNPNLSSEDGDHHEAYNKVNKQLNIESTRAMLFDKLTEGKPKRVSLNQATLSQFNSECSSSSSTSSTGAPSVCSSDSVKSKKYDLPTAASIQAMSYENHQKRSRTAKYGPDDLFATEV